MALWCSSMGWQINRYFPSWPGHPPSAVRRPPIPALSLDLPLPVEMDDRAPGGSIATMPVGPGTTHGTTARLWALAIEDLTCLGCPLVFRWGMRSPDRNFWRVTGAGGSLLVGRCRDICNGHCRAVDRDLQGSVQRNCRCGSPVERRSTRIRSLRCHDTLGGVTGLVSAITHQAL